MVASGCPLRECKAIVNFFLYHGADTKLKDPDDETASMLANEAGHNDVVNLIQAIDQVR